MAGEVHPVPFRTRKLSPLAPMVLRSSPWESRTSLTNEGHLRAEGPVTRVVAGPSCVYERVGCLRVLAGPSLFMSALVVI